MDLDLNLVNIIMQNYPVIRESSEADWLDALILLNYSDFFDPGVLKVKLVFVWFFPSFLSLHLGFVETNLS